MENKQQRKISESFKEVKSIRCGKRKQENQSPQKNNSSDSDSSFNDYIKIKQALHLSKPQSLPCRDDKIEQVYKFIHGNLSTGKPGSMYISGAPGTGKTAVVQHVMDRLCTLKTEEQKFVSIFINCMSKRNPSSIFDEIQETLKASAKAIDLKDQIRKRMCSKTAKPVVLVLDEMDQLLGRSNETLYTIFEWTRQPNSKLVLVGIANSLDLTVRHLPMLTASSKNSSPRPRTSRSIQSIIPSIPSTPPEPCKLIQFTPYEREDIERILESRINEVGSHLFEPTAIKFVAAKVAASTGDMRKALNACQMALDKNEKTQRPALKATADDGFNSSSPKKIRPPDQKIGVVALSKILGPQKDDGVLPLQQKIILATLLKVHKRAPTSLTIPNDGVVSGIPISKFYDEYRKICTDKGLSWIDRSELCSICELLEDRSLVHVSTSQASKLKKNVKSKEGIFFDPRATEKILAGDPIVASIVG